MNYDHHNYVQQHFLPVISLVPTQINHLLNFKMPSLKLLANYGVTAFLLSTGLLMLLSPTTMAALFGMPIEDDTFAAGFVQCMGGRNLTFGIIAGIFLQRRDLRAVSTMASMLTLDGLVDGLVTFKYAGFGAALPHFGAAAVVPFVSAWMAS